MLASYLYSQQCNSYIPASTPNTVKITTTVVNRRQHRLRLALRSASVSFVFCDRSPYQLALSRHTPDPFLRNHLGLLLLISPSSRLLILLPRLLVAVSSSRNLFGLPIPSPFSFMGDTGVTVTNASNLVFSLICSMVNMLHADTEPANVDVMEKQWNVATWRGPSGFLSRRVRYY